MCVTDMICDFGLGQTFMLWFFFSDFYFKPADVIMTESASSTAGFVFKKKENSDKVFCEAEVSSTTQSRFKPLSSSEELDKLSGKQFSENTDRKISWAIEMFRDWRKERMVDPACPSEILWCCIDDPSLCKEHLCKTLCRFVNEVEEEGRVGVSWENIVRFGVMHTILSQKEGYLLETRR